MERLKIHTNNQFFIDRVAKNKMVTYCSFRYNEKLKKYEFYNKYEKLKLGVQLCDFINTDFNSFESAKAFIDKYSITAIAELSNMEFYRYYNSEEYEDMIKEVIEKCKKPLTITQKDFIKDIEYIYNLNNLEELNNLSPAKRLYILKESKRKSRALEIYDDSKIKLAFNNFGNFARSFYI